MSIGVIFLMEDFLISEKISRLNFITTGLSLLSSTIVIT